MKLFFIFVFIVVTFVNADYLNTKTNNCVKDLIPYHAENRGWCHTNSASGNHFCVKNQKYTDYINGFYNDDNSRCVMYQDLQKTGMTYSQFQFQEALLANMYGFFIFFLVGFLFVLQGRR